MRTTLTPALPKRDPTFLCFGALFVVGFVKPAFGVEFELKFEEVEGVGEKAETAANFAKSFSSNVLVAALRDGMSVR